MLDVIREMIATALSISTADVNAIREALLQEQATEDARYAASSALIHPEGSSTPINEAFSRAQNRVANLREKVVKEMPSTFAMLMALEIATQRRDEAEEHRNMKFDAAYAKQVDGVRPEVRDWWARLARHGVHPHYLKQHSEPTIAIIADLVQWKAKDATFKDPDNPWRALLGTYASRLVEKPTKRGKSARSTPGTPKRNPHPGGDKHYMFNEMVSAGWGMTELPAFDAPVASTPAITEERATEIATAIYDGMPLMLGIYWPREGVAQFDYDANRLIPALERAVESGAAWPGHVDFLAAARQGRAKEFIAERRANGIRYTAGKLIEGDAQAVANAQKIGYILMPEAYLPEPS